MDERQRFTALYAAHLKKVLGFAARRCDSPADAADIVSEVFLVAWRRLADVPPGNEALLWLYRVALNLLANQRRGIERRRRLGQALQDAWAEAAADDPAGLFTIGEDAAAVRAALAQLRPADASLLTLVAWDDLTPAEAATVLGITPTAARQRLSRARKRLRQLLPDARPPDPAGVRISVPYPIAVEERS